MLPGSFIVLLLQISDFSDFAAEHFAEALHFGIGQRAAASLSSSADGFGAVAASAAGIHRRRRRVTLMRIGLSERSAERLSFRSPERTSPA